MAHSTCGRHPSDLCQRFLCGTRRPLSAQQNIRVHFSSEQIFRDSRFSDSFQNVRAATNQDTSSTSQRFVTVQQSRVPIVDSRDRGRPSNADYDPRNLRNLQCPDRVPGCSGNRIHVYRRLHLVRSVEGVEAAGPHRGQHRDRPVTLSLLSSNTFQGHIRALTVMGATYTYQITHDHRLRGARHGTAPDVSHLDCDVTTLNTRALSLLQQRISEMSQFQL